MSKRNWWYRVLINDRSSTHGGNRGTAIYDKEIVSKEMPETATKSPQSFSVIKERCEEEIATMRDQYAPRIQEEIRHITFPEIMECDMSMDKSHETSKIMKFMETISENVVMKNPLGKVNDCGIRCIVMVIDYVR